MKKTVRRSAAKKSGQSAARPRTSRAGGGKFKFPFSRRQVWVTGIVAAVFGLTVLLLALIFDPQPERRIESLTGQDIAFQIKLMRRLSRELFSSPPVEVSTIGFTRDEIESLNRLADFSSQLALNTGNYEGFPVREYRIVYRGSDGKVDFTVPLDTGWRWLFGGVLRLHGVGTPEKSGDIIDVKIHRFRAGKIPLPSWFGEWLLKRLIDDWREDESFDDFNAALRDLWIAPDGKLMVVYRPRGLSVILR